MVCRLYPLTVLQKASQFGTCPAALSARITPSAPIPADVASGRVSPSAIGYGVVVLVKLPPIVMPGCPPYDQSPSQYSESAIFCMLDIIELLIDGPFTF